MSIKALQEYIAMSISLRLWRNTLKARHGLVRSETLRSHNLVLSESQP